MASATPSDMERLSDLIGAIYDCAIDPDRWDETLDRVRELLISANSTLYVYDLANKTQRLHRVVGVEPLWQQRMIEWGDSIAEIYDHIDAANWPLDRIFVMRRDLSDAFLRSNFYFMNWAVPQGIDDLLQVVLLRSSTRMSALALGRYGRDGHVTDREVHLIQLLAPHIRRAIAISDLIDMKTVEADTLGSSLDTLSAGVVLVTEDGGILYANLAARQIFDDGGPIRAVAGKIQAGAPSTTARLMRAIADAASGEASAGDVGLGLPVTNGESSVYIAHVLPVTRGDVRARLAPRAVAAVFIGSADTPLPVADLASVGEAFGLTRGELAVLEEVVQGHPVSEAAKRLGIARTTAKTHMSRILAKTGTRRQPALMALVNRLSPPIGAMSGSQAQRSGRG